MNVKVIEREFVYSGSCLADPNPKLSIEEVRSFYANQFPELTTAAISGPETDGPLEAVAQAVTNGRN